MSQSTLLQLERGRRLRADGKDPQYLTPTQYAQYTLAATAASYGRARARMRRLLPRHPWLGDLPLACEDCCEARRMGDQGCRVHPAGSGAN